MQNKVTFLNEIFICMWEWLKFFLLWIFHPQLQPWFIWIKHTSVPRPLFPHSTLSMLSLLVLSFFYPLLSINILQWGKTFTWASYNIITTNPTWFTDGSMWFLLQVPLEFACIWSFQFISLHLVNSLDPANSTIWCVSHNIVQAPSKSGVFNWKSLSMRV